MKKLLSSLSILFFFLSCSEKLPDDYSRFAEKDAPMWHKGMDINEIAYLDSLVGDSKKGSYPREVYLGAVRQPSGAIQGYYLEILCPDSMTAPYVGFTGYDLPPIKLDEQGKPDSLDVERAAKTVIDVAKGLQKKKEQK